VFFPYKLCFSPSDHIDNNYLTDTSKYYCISCINSAICDCTLSCPIFDILALSSF
jgi:hypothetical protein